METQYKEAKNIPNANQPEPWLCGTHSELDAVARQFVHSMEQAEEDLERWCGGLSDQEMNARPMQLAPVAFHLRHIARSLDRLLSYAEGTQLDATQMAVLRAELDPGATRAGLFAELKRGLEDAKKRTLAFSPAQYNDERVVGKKMLPTTIGSLVVHCAEHTQRHVGQAITTAKVVQALRGEAK
jgi:uncharacterized damage-inducible protein DinB